MNSITFSNIATLKIWGDDYHCVINGTGKNKVENLLQNVGLIEKTGTFQNIIFVQHV